MSILIVWFYIIHNAALDQQNFKKLSAYITHKATTEWHRGSLFIRLHAASSGATMGFILLFSHMQKYSRPKTCKHTLMCKDGAVTL